MKPYFKFMLAGVALLAIAAVGTQYYETLPGLVIKHPITGAVTAHINGTNGTVTAGAFVGDGSGLTGVAGAPVGTLVTNGTAVSAGDILAVGSRTTNLVAATSANLQLIEAQKSFRQWSSLLTPADAGVDLNFNGAQTKSSLVLTGNVILTFSGIVTNGHYELLIVGCSTNSIVTWPAGVHGQPPGVAEANKWLRVDCAIWDPAGTGVLGPTNVVVSQLPDL